MSALSPWRFAEYRGRRGLVALEDDWRRLCESMSFRTSSHSFDAQLAYVDNVMTAPDELRCLALSDGRMVRAICLLEPRVDRTLGIPVRVWRVPLPSHNPLGDVVCPDDEARRALLPALVAYLRSSSGGRHLVVVGPLPEDSSLWTGLARVGESGSFAVPAGSMHVFDCTRPFDELMARTSKRFRQDLRRHDRRLHELPGVQFKTVARGADLAEAFETFLEVEASGWKGEAGARSAIRLRPRHAGFFQALLGVRGSNENCEISALYADGRCIASEFCMRAGSDYSGIRMGYDESYARLAPGHILMHQTLRRCCEDPTIERFNLTSDSSWQLPWHPDAILLRQGYLAIDRWSGLSLIALLRLRFGYGRQCARWMRDLRERLRHYETRDTDHPTNGVARPTKERGREKPTSDSSSASSVRTK